MSRSPFANKGPQVSEVLHSSDFELRSHGQTRKPEDNDRARIQDDNQLLRLGKKPVLKVRRALNVKHADIWLMARA